LKPGQPELSGEVFQAKTLPAGALSLRTIKPSSKQWQIPCPSGQYILVKAIRALDKLRDQGWKVQLHWIPSHIGIAGNEAADQAAKEASGYSPYTLPNPEPQSEPESLQILTATTKPTIRQTMRRVEAVLGKAKHGRELYRLGVRPGKGISPYILAYIERTAQLLRKCAPAKSACAPGLV
jgi:hypothetical protein